MTIAEAAQRTAPIQRHELDRLSIGIMSLLCLVWGFNQISIFAIDQATGMLNSVGWESTRGKTPRFFTIDPSGKFLYAANETSDTIVGFRIDENSGKLAAIGTVAQTGSPVCIVFRSSLTV